MKSKNAQGSTGLSTSFARGLQRSLEAAAKGTPEQDARATGAVLVNVGPWDIRSEVNNSE